MLVSQLRQVRPTWQSGKMPMKHKIQPFAFIILSGNGISIRGGQGEGLGISVNSGKIQTHISNSIVKDNI